MPESIGPHLLGRNAHPGDECDYSLEEVIEAGTANPVDLALSAVLKSKAAPAVKAYLKLVNAQLDKLTPTPTPPAPPAPPAPTPPAPTPPAPPAPPAPGPSGAVAWTKDSDVTLDQGDTGHCCGFGSAQFRNTNPVNDDVDNTEGHATYYRLKVIDEEPNAEDGSTVHSVAKDLVNEGRVKTYAWATTVAAMKTWVLNSGPLVVGFDWYNDMFNPDTNGLVTPTGGIAGGHCFTVVGYDPATDLFKFLNSWSDAWGIGGYFFMTSTDVAFLLGSDGAECMAAIELPLAAAAAA